MTYLQFLIVFLGLPLVILGGLTFRSQLPLRRQHIYGILALVLLAVSYTTPWDNYLVMTKVWWYGADRVIGTIGYVPIEEYAFFVLQTVATGLFCFLLQSRLPLEYEASKAAAKRWVSSLYLALFAFGVYGLFVPSLTYFGLILAWAMPVVLLQWFVGGGHLLKNWRLWMLTTLAPSIYFWFADAYAIHVRIWEISAAKTTGIKFAGLPIEEAVFFLVTNLMVSQGLILFVVMRAEVYDFVQSFRFRLKEGGV